MQDNDDIMAPPYARVGMMEDMICLELGIIPISLCAKHDYSVGELLKSMSPEEARRATRKWRKVKRQAKKHSTNKKGAAEKARWNIRLKAWDRVS